MGLEQFVAGWFLGAKTGNKGFDEMVQTGRGLVQSKEFRDFLEAGRAHLGYSLRELGDLIAGDRPGPAGEDLLDIVRSLVQRRDSVLPPRWRGEPPEAGGQTPRAER